MQLDLSLSLGSVHTPPPLDIRGLASKVQTDFALWTPQACALVPGQQDPYNGPGAVILRESGGTSTHDAFAPPASPTGARTAWIWFKPIGRTIVEVTLGTNAVAYLNLATRLVGTVTGDATASVISTAGAWQLWKLTGTWSAGANMFIFAAATDGANTYASAGVDSIGVYFPVLQ